jgi:hypothetical protein
MVELQSTQLGRLPESDFKLTESDIRLLLGIPSGLAGLQMVTRNQNVSWSDSRYITYVLKSEPIGPFQHTSLSPKASDGNTVMQFSHTIDPCG